MNSTSKQAIGPIKDHSGSRMLRAMLFVREHGVAEVLRRARQHGLKGSAGFVLRNMRHAIAARSSRSFDKALGVDTAGSLQLQYLTIDSPNAGAGTEAVSTSPRSFDWMLKAIPRPLSGHTFIDVGCGKGRTLLLAAKHGFHEAVGVEFAAELVEIARKNLLDAQKAFPRGASIVHADAASFVFPDAPLVVYLYNPFGEEVAGKVMDNLASRLQASPADCFLIYGSSKPETIAWFKPMVAAFGLFDEIAVQPMPLFLDAVRTIHYCVYRRKPQSIST
jgi:predicted RNA methylase